MSTDSASVDADPDAGTDTETEPEPEPETETEPAPDLTSEAGGFSCKATVGTLLAYFEQYTPLLDEIKLHIDRDGLEAIGVDPANVASVDQRLDKQAFVHYSSTGGVIGLDLGRITDVLELGETGDLAAIELDQETRKLEITIDGMEFTMALIDPKSIRKEPEKPDLELPASVTLEGRDLSRAVTAAEMVSDHIQFEVGETDDGEDALLVSASGDTDDVDLTLTRDELIDLEMGEAESLFSLDYLEDMMKVVPADAEVTLELGVEMPVFIHYEHIEGDSDDSDEEHHAEVTQMLAPRISSED